MLNRIDQTFSRLKKAKRKALIGYVTAGFPTKASFKTLIPLLEKSGADLLEVGVPFSDPIADGPTIQHSSQVALKNGVTLEWVLSSVRQLRREGVKLPLIFMSYCNPIHAMGIDAFFKQAKSCGVDGLIIPDMIPEEAEAYAQSSRKHGLDFIYLVAPTTPKSRIRLIANKTRGFLYAVSLTGVTGVRKALPAEVAGFLKSVKAVSRKPVAVGFGITSPKQAKSLSHYADGIIVGSELIRQIEKSRTSAFQGAAHFMNSLKGAINAS
jgi:tryptophan synthase alpha chain